MKRNERRDVLTTTITIEVPIGLKTYLEALLHTGLYGNTVEQAAHWIIADEVRRLIFDKQVLQRRTWS